MQNNRGCTAARVKHGGPGSLLTGRHNPAGSEIGKHFYFHRLLIGVPLSMYGYRCLETDLAE